jgi:hypothetical protein
LRSWKQRRIENVLPASCRRIHSKFSQICRAGGTPAASYSGSARLKPQIGGADFSLILTFSLGEKEQPLVDFVKFASIRAAFSRCLAKTLEAILPLPKGEGRGEGERHDPNVSATDLFNRP